MTLTEHLPKRSVVHTAHTKGLFVILLCGRRGFAVFAIWTALGCEPAASRAA